MLRVLLIVLSLCVSARASATPADLGVVIEGDGWTEAERASLRRGAEAVPPAIRAFVGPIRFVRSSRRCPFAMGAYNRSCPTYATGKQQSFVVYPNAAVQGQGPTTRLAALNPTELRDLLVRRAVVHAFIASADRRRKWSSDDAWRRLNFWREGSDQAFNRDPWGYSRYLGMRSAHLDLVTFAEEYFVRPEIVLEQSASDDAATRLNGLDPDLSVRCQAFSKSRFLAERVRAFDQTWLPPEDPNALETGCGAFDRWADLPSIEGIDVLLAAATGDRPQSLWGHLLVHIRHRDRADGFESVYQFGAVVSSNIDPVEYLTRGLMGGYQAVLDAYEYREIDRQILRTEQRSLKRYRLQLSDRQTLWVLQRIWEMERRTRLPYWFFDENCAAFLADLLQSALINLELETRSDFIVAPTDVLDLLAAVDNPPHGKLIRKLPEESASNRARALWARARRDELMTDVRSELDDGARQAFDAAWTGLRQPDAAEREAAYRSIGPLLIGAMGQVSAEQRTLMHTRSAKILGYNVELERYFLESRIAQANAVWAAIRNQVDVVTAEDLLRRRRLLYVHEDLDRRRRQKTTWDEDKLLAFQSADRRPLRAGEKRIVAEQDATRAAFAAAIDARRDFFEAHDTDAAHLARAEAEGWLHHREEMDRRSVGHSGKERANVGVAGTFAGGAGQLQLQLGFAFLDERLGSQRTRGFRPDIETQVFAVGVLVPLLDTRLDPVPAAPSIDLTLLRYFSIEQLIRPARNSWTDMFGYGFDIHVLSDPSRGISWGAGASGGLILPLVVSEDVSSHFILGAFPIVEGLVGDTASRALGGIWMFARMQAHLFGNFANALRLEAQATPVMDLQTLAPALTLGTQVEVPLYLGELGQRPVTLVPHAGGERTNVRIGNDDVLVSWSAGLRLESGL